MERFEGRVVIVTGAASGIGRATVSRLASEGASIVAVDVTKDALDEVAAGVGAGRCEPVAGDVTDPACADAAVRVATERYGGLHGLANVAGILRTGHTHEFDVDEWRRVLDVNLTGTFLFCRAALPSLLAGRGAIVNIASTAALTGHPWTAAYSASKGGVLSLTRCLAVEYGRQGVRANTVCPGSIETPIYEHFGVPEGADARLVNRIMALDRSRGPETVAAAIAFLLSDDAEHVNGDELRVDGGALS
jgi:NAD(P)-dependent dehydrogenase (short-subunit alcohol dehydrogenase family)